MFEKKDIKRLPAHLRRPLGDPKALHGVKRILRARGLHTVCESAKCPNIGECFSKPTATFMILGGECTRRCGFCAVDKGVGLPAPDAGEAENVAQAAAEMKLRHVVITSVTRDDLADGGAMQFALTIRAVRRALPNAVIEVLTPDFGGSDAALDTVISERPDVFNHNVETVKRLYAAVRPEADYERSLRVLRTAADKGASVKSGIMVGLGETVGEVEETIDDLARAGCSAITIGQYLRPASVNLDVVEFVSEEAFAAYAAYAKKAGIERPYSGPFVRSSYNAEEAFSKAMTA